MSFSSIDPDTVKRKMRFDYLKIKTDFSSRTLDAISALLGHFSQPHVSVHELIQDAATTIQKQFRFRWVMVGLKDNDGMFRYKVMSGMRPEAWERHKTKAYRQEDFTPASNNYEYGEISKLSRVYLEEENTLAKVDEASVNRPALLRSKRSSDADCLEADFVDTLILGSRDDMLGWIEYSGTVAGEFPDPNAIKYVELISAILAAAVARS